LVLVSRDRVRRALDLADTAADARLGDELRHKACPGNPLRGQSPGQKYHKRGRLRGPPPGEPLPPPSGETRVGAPADGQTRRAPRASRASREGTRRAIRRSRSPATAKPSSST